jgi:hypothetical protein
MVKKIFVLLILSVCLLGFQVQQATSLRQIVAQKGIELADAKARYVANTLDQENTEKLTIIDDKFDCVTFIEYCIAYGLHKTMIDKPSVESCVTQIRYHLGNIDGYGSRIHYFSEWILQIQAYGYGRDITKELGGVQTSKTINFMSKHPSLYPKLDKRGLVQIKEAEKRISNASRYTITKQMVKSIENQIKTGDIIAFSTSKLGLDYTHTGIAFVNQAGQTLLLHASQSAKKVVLSTETISNYLQLHPAMDGIAVLRLN